MAEHDGATQVGKATPPQDIHVADQRAPPTDGAGFNPIQKYCKLVASRPLTTWCVLIIIVLFICLLPVAVFSGDLIVLDFGLGSMLVRGNDISDRYLATRAAQCGGQCLDKEKRRLAPDSEEEWEKKEEEDRGKLTMAYVSKDEKNILTESRLKQALSLERQAAKILGEPLQTQLQRLFPSYPESSGAPAGETLQALLVTVAESVTDTRNQHSTPWPPYDMNFSACTPQSQLVSSLFRNTWEFETFENQLSHLETDDVYATFFWTVHSWTGGWWFDTQRNDQIASDTLLIIGVLLAALVILALHTRSVFIAFAGLFSILLATGVAFSLYRTLVSKWFGVLNAFSIFLLLGIACDDIFVVADAWRQATEMMGLAPDDYEGRLRYTFQHSFMAITTTSLTTAGAFFGNAISTIPPLRLFGVFSGFMVIADWLLTLLVLPSVLVMQHKLFGKSGCGSVRCGAASAAGNAPRMIDSFLARRFAPCVFKAAPALAVFFAAVAALALNIALELPPGAAFHESDLFPKDHVQSRAYRAQEAMSNLYPEYGYVEIMHGVKPEDHGDMNNPQSRPEVVWDRSFDMRSVDTQQFIFDLCDDLLAQRGLVRRLYTCWAQDVQRQTVGTNLSFPIASPSRLDSMLYNSIDDDGVFKHGGHLVSRIVLQTTLVFDASTSDIRKSHDLWEEWMQRWNDEARRRGITSAANGFQTSERWRFMSTVENMATSCIAASCISTSIVAVLLLLLLRNVVVVSMILAHVMAACLSLMAILVIEGRKLGVLEGIASTLLVGLSVDYLVHVGKAYLDESEDQPRERRTLNAVSHLGGSVLAGSFTTVISAIFLCVGTITFFVTFGRFVMTMILLALIFTLLSLVSWLYLFGPSNNFSHIPCPKRCTKATRRMSLYATQLDEANVLTQDVEVKPASNRTRLAVGICTALLMCIAGAIRVWLSFRVDDIKSPVCPELSELEFTFNQYAIPPDKDSYRCIDYDAIPAGCTYWMTEFEPIITDGLEGVVHHMILFSADQAASTCPYTCFDMPTAVGIDAAWAVGGGKLTWPPGMAYAIGGYRQALQMHYNNYEQKPGKIDTRSGLKLKLTSTKPNTTITNIMVGLHPLGVLSIPGRMKSVLRFTECSLRLRGKVTVLAYSTHAHKLGRSVITEIHRSKSMAIGKHGQAGSKEVVGDVGSTPSYDFNYQHIKMFSSGQERHLLPGDSVRVTCGYNSESREGHTASGWGSEDEMCLTILYVYPSENVESTSCLGDYSYSHNLSVAI